MLVKNLVYFLVDKNIKSFCNIPEEKYFVPLRILYSFIKSFVNAFGNIASNFFNSLFNSFSTSTCFVLFELISFYGLLVYYQNLSFLQNQ